MQLTSCADAGEFLENTRPVLEQNEVANNLMFGIAIQLQQSKEPASSRPYFAVVQDGGDLLLAALMTPPYPLVLCRPRALQAEVYALVVRQLIAERWAVRAVSGTVPVAQEFAAVWTALTGAACKVNMHERIYELREVQPVSSAPGRLRVATRADTDLVGQWAYDFFVEALPDGDPSIGRDNAIRRIDHGSIFLWENGGQPMSMAAKARPIVSAITVNLVYTPLTLRGRGYATNCVAALSKRLLEEGWKSCALFTDLANPTSNSIYQKIGYIPVCDFDEYGLG